MAARDPSAELMRLINAHQISQAIHIATTLGIADLLLNTATYWHALRQCGIDDKVQGFGRLLAEF